MPFPYSRAATKGKAEEIDQILKIVKDNKNLNIGMKACIDNMCDTQGQPVSLKTKGGKWKVTL